MPYQADDPPELQVGSGLAERWQDRSMAVLEDELRRSGVSSPADWQAAEECFRRLGAVPVRFVDGRWVPFQAASAPVEGLT